MQLAFQGEMQVLLVFLGYEIKFRKYLLPFVSDCIDLGSGHLIMYYVWLSKAFFKSDILY